MKKKKSLIDDNEANLKKAKLFFQYRPFTTKVYLVMQTGLPMKFVRENWDKIIS